MKSRKQLVTTALRSTWNIDKKMYCLGQWCLPYADKKDWESLDYVVLPYHWDDRKKLFSDYQYVKTVIDDLLLLYKKKLSVIHGVDWPSKSWRALLYPWLSFSVGCLFDRYDSIRKLADQYPNEFYSRVLFHKKNIEPPCDMNETMNLFINNDTFNWYVYSHVIKDFDEICSVLHDAEDLCFSQPKEKSSKGIKRFMREALFFFLTAHNKVASLFSSDLFFFSTGFSYKALFKLQWTLKKPVLFYRPVSIKPRDYSAADHDLRESFVLTDSTDGFKDFCLNILPAVMPKSFLENFQKVNEKVSGCFPKNPKLLLSSTAHYADDFYKHYSAQMMACGVKRFSEQHGGHFGTSPFSRYDDIENAISDCFLTWGWSDQCGVEKKVLPASKLSCLSNIKEKYNSSGSILIPLLDIPRYSYSIYAVHIASQLENYFSCLEEFFYLINKNIKGSIDCRVPSGSLSYKNDLTQRIYDISSDLKTHFTSNCSFQNAIKKSRLVICTYNATTFLESFSLNHPTVIFWDPYYFELNTDAQPFFNLLRKVGILYYDYESAARHVNDIFQDPLSWWMQEKVQAAKDEFCQQYAYVGNNPLQEWADELRSQIEN